MKDRYRAIESIKKLGLLLNKRVTDESAGAYADYLLNRLDNYEISEACKRCIDDGTTFFPSVGNLAKFSPVIKESKKIGSCGICIEGITLKDNPSWPGKGLNIAVPCSCEFGRFVSNQNWN